MATAATPAVAQQEFRMVPLNLLRASRSNPRESFDGPEQQDLVASIREKGIIEPLIVRPRPNSDTEAGRVLSGHHFEVVAGERRFRAAQELKLEAAPCIVRQLDDVEALEIQIIENLQRKDVTALMEAKGYQRLRDGWHAPGAPEPPKQTVEQIARKVGKSKEHVYARLKLTELSGPAKEAIEQERITPGHAILLARLQPKDQAEALKASQGNKWNGPMSVRDLDQHIDEHYRLDLGKAPWSPVDPSLVPAAGACSTCPKQAKGRCEDRACYQGKLAAFIEQRRKAFPGAPLVMARDWGYSANDEKEIQKRYPGALTQNDYRDAGAKKCPDTKLALLVAGGAPGTHIKICTKKSCKVHRDPYAYSHSSYSAPKKSAKTIEKEKREKEATALQHKVDMLALTSLAGCKLELGQQDLVRIAMWFDENMDFYGDMGERMMKLAPMVAPKKLEGWKPAALASRIGLMLLAAAIKNEYNPDRAYFEAVCKRHKIDLGKLRKELQKPAPATAATKSQAALPASKKGKAVEATQKT